MAKNDERELAKQFFLQTEKTQKEIASIVNTQESTVSRWVREGEWEALKKTLQTSDEKIIIDLYAELNKINQFVKDCMDGIPDSRTADARNKVIASINRMQKQVALPQKVAVCMQLVDFIAATDLKVAKQMDAYVSKYLHSQKQ